MTNILHVYGQRMPHTEAWVVGDLEGLQRLKAAVERAIAEGSGVAHAFVEDGEGYPLLVIQATDDKLEKLVMPYTHEMYETAIQNGTRVHPADLLPAARYATLVREGL
jgi:hypothetical protein